MINNDFDKEIDGILNNDNLFKPITDGLGFHHSIKNKNEIKSSLSQRSLDLKEDIELRKRELSKKSSTRAAADPIQMGELAPFYGVQEEKKLTIDIDNKIASVQTASNPKRFVAWIFDVTIISLILSVVFIGTLITSGISLDYVKANILDLEFLLSSVLMFVCFYVFYFSFFDKTKYSSPGKHLLGLQVVDINQKSISFTSSVVRSLITLFSVLTLGLASILKLQDKLTDTDVIIYE